ncbi:MAG: Efflux pump membrane transporter BepE [Chroococcidiopsis cubana SAG 39.79]|uniref:Multidrug efflux RND transporter permease subunit n=3 Tax=Chroococcidiopsis TaxID=54298 RepID=A0AB37UD29_9CYAN|nr:efflux RND transporter permease subunit [Chroococcidiopsis cubana]MDZ4872151.1 Efflux pump membrane transporter BepE [Chroococcidiopsis cubana SAG 39.79]RUT04138.1 multidrug efflux RND transporter permease subunit [Chroococcidiopsis cubana SAG 39.79]
MFSDNFIKRPVLSIVCALVILLVGAIAIPTLPVEQYPDISPVQVVVTGSYIGASAQVVEETVTSVLERQINGVKGMRYMTSSSGNDGTSTITVTFQQGYNQDIAAVDVQNRVAIAEPQLPEDVRRVGIIVRKQSAATVVGIAIYSDDGRYNSEFISNYADIYILDTLKRINGVGDIFVNGERRYAMRLWLDPNRLASRGLTAQDVANALNEQNLQLGIGRIGQSPTNDGQMYQIDLQAVGRLREPQEFNNLILRSDPDGTLVKLSDVGRAELGAENYDTFARWSRRDAVGYRIVQLPGSNALETANAIKAEMVRLEKSFPPGLKYEIPYDPTLFVVESREEVLKTLYEAIALVVIVIFVFLQDWRATLIPLITIPVSLVGTFAFIKAFNFSMNSLTLFGITLATGLVVDDAIVVVEDIARLIQQEKVEPRKAAFEAMHELFGAVIATSLVLMAVFIPVAFFPGTTGQLYKQFALTIAFSIALSTFLALTITPALSAILLRPQEEATTSGILSKPFALFNRCIDWLRRSYRRSLNFLNRLKYVVLSLFVASLGLTAWFYLHVPTGFLPEEDQGLIINIVQAPDGSSLNYTTEVIKQLEDVMLEFKDVAGTFTLGGLGTIGNTANSAFSYAPLLPWSEREGHEHSAQAILEAIRKPLSKISEANILSVNLPTIQGLGSIGGFTFELQDRGNNGIDTLIQVKNDLLARANEAPELENVFTTFSANAPQTIVEVDRDRARALQVPINDVFRTLQIYLGSQYVNDFNAFTRTYRVYVQADRAFRSNLKDVGKLYVRSSTGTMIPLSEIVQFTSVTGPQIISHYNLFRSIEINGTPAAGYSSGQAIAAMERIAAEVLPNSMSFEWSGLSLEEISSGGQAPIIFALGLIFVFLVLAGQYENFLDPIIIMLTVPLAVLGAMMAQSWRGLPNDVYCQVGLVMLIGLASKNAILIVEFANQLREQGLSITKAAIEASESRLRPILMTSFSFVLGILPLVMAEGAGSGSRISLGTAVFGGMMVSTLLSLFVVPILYIMLRSLFARFSGGKGMHFPNLKKQWQVLTARLQARFQSR